MTNTITSTQRFEGAPVKGSRFIVDIAPVADESVARLLLEQARRDFPDASHHCWAWRIAQPAIDRASDDGEPNGSAGRPILAQLTGRDLVDVAAIVTRYFGGTKLGVGGLVRAYGGAVGAALDELRLTPWVAETTIRFRHDYAHTDTIERLIQETSASILSRDFTEAVLVEIRLPVDAVAAFQGSLGDITSGAAKLLTDD